MTNLNNGSARIRFGQFEADLSQGKLLKRGVVVRLEHRPFQVLASLLESPGNVVTREELKSRLWPSGTYVDFDEGLNTAVRKLRAALGDSSESPVFVETVPRRGYIFVAPVEYAPAILVMASNIQPESTVHPIPAFSAPIELHSATVAQKSHGKLIAMLAAVCVIAFTCIGVLWQIRYRTSTRTEPEFTRMSFGRGLIISARFTPDGQNVVYGAAWDGKPFRPFLARRGTPDVLALNVEAEVLSISRSGEMAFLLHRRFRFRRIQPWHTRFDVDDRELAAGSPRRCWRCGLVS